MDTFYKMRNTGSVLQRMKFAVGLLCVAFGTAPNAGAQSKVTSNLAAPPSSTHARLVDAIVVVVNSEIVTRQELDERLRLVERRMRTQGIALPPRAELQKQLLERMIVEHTQMQLAKETGIRVDDAMLDHALGRIAEQNKMSLKDFRERLEKEGTPFGKFREEIRQEIVMQRLREREVDNKIQVSESEIDNYLAVETGAGQPGQELNVAQILVRVPENASAEQVAERRQRAEDVLRQLKSGADFAKLAATYSDGSEALSGGELGWRTANRLPQLFIDTLTNMQQGEISSLVKSSNGFHILKLVGKRSASVVKTGDAAPASVQQTHARHILVKVNQVVSATEAKRRLLELKQRLDNNAAKFDELARLYSNDLSASKGGDLGWIYPGDTVPEFERAMNALQPGQVSEPVESPFGYHLIQVLERKVDDVSQERQRFAARQAIRERKVEEAADDWLRQLRDRAYVEYRSDDK